MFGRAQYLNLLINEYGLHTVLKKKPVIDLNDLYLLFYTHWDLDDQMYHDERQRVQVVPGFLAAVIFVYRPCSLFDTRVKLDDGLGEPVDDLPVTHGRSDPQYEMDDVDMNAGTNMQQQICSTRVSVTVWWFSILAKKSIAIPAQLMRVITTTAPALPVRMISTAIAIPAHSIIQTTTTAIPMTTVVLGRRRPGRSCIGSSPSPLKATFLHTKGEDNNPWM